MFFHVEQCVYFAPLWGEFLLFSMITAIEKQFYKDVSRTPLFGHPGDDHAELPTDAFIEVEEAEASGSKALPHDRPSAGHEAL
jgi:hypothetical protein